MRIVGDWFLFEDGESRPMLRAKIPTGRGGTLAEQFLVDTGADRTVFSAALLAQLFVSQQRRWGLSTLNSSA